jgi:hypothetical protein
MKGDCSFVFDGRVNASWATAFMQGHPNMVGLAYRERSRIPQSVLAEDRFGILSLSIEDARI